MKNTFERRVKEDQFQIDNLVLKWDAPREDKHGIYSISKSFKELEIDGLRNQNKNLESLALKRDQERKASEAKCKELQDKNDKLS